MTNDSSDYTASAQRILDEHQRINIRGQRIREELQLIGNATRLQQLIEEFTKLHDELTRHFAEEKEAGVFKEAVLRKPNLAAEAKRLEEQHSKLLTDLGAICAKAESASLAVQTIKETVGEFNAFIDALLAHETEENRVMAQGFSLHLENERH